MSDEGRRLDNDVEPARPRPPAKLEAVSESAVTAVDASEAFECLASDERGGERHGHDVFAPVVLALIDVVLDD